MNKKKLISLIVGAIIGFLVPQLLLSQDVSTSRNNQKLANSLLWKIDGNNLETHSYLYGTMHILCVDSFALPEKALKAFEQTEVLELEIDFTDPEQLAMMQSSMMAEEKLSKTLDSVQLEIVSQFATEQLGLTLEQVEDFDVSALLLMAQIQLDDCSSPKSVEADLMKLAMETKHEMAGLETVEYQMEMIKDASSLEESIARMKDFDRNDIDFHKAQNLYLAEQIVDCASIFVNSNDMTEKEIELIVNKRNRDWAERIPAQIQEKSTFIAVGTAHLVGEEGLINLLRAQGYKVEPVY